MSSDFFQNQLFRKIHSGLPSVSNNFHSVQVQALHFVGRDLVPNCLKRLSADDTNRYRVNDLED